VINIFYILKCKVILFFISPNLLPLYSQMRVAKVLANIFPGAGCFGLFNIIG